jgi:hypothetical protein
MTTPEGKVKRKVSTFLKSVDQLYYTMPVPSGYGESTLDYLGCYKGHFFAIETKAPGGRPTARQEQCMSLMERAGAKVFVIDGDLTLNALQHWVRTLK